MIDDLMTKFRLDYKPNSDSGYHIKPSNEVFLFPDRQAHLIINGVNAGVRLSLILIISYSE
jgi:hypothetical protein